MNSSIPSIVAASAPGLLAAEPDLSVALLAIVRARDVFKDVRPANVENYRTFIASQLDEAVDALQGKMLAVPPVCGGGHDDDFEEIDPDFIADPATWPAWCDEHRWELGEPCDDKPLPLGVLASVEPGLDDVDPFAPLPGDNAWFTLDPIGLTDADLMAQGLPVG